MNSHPHETNASTAQTLWDALEVLHCAINALARHAPSRPISDSQRKTLQTLFKQVQILLEDHSILVTCARIEDQGLSAGDALLVIGQYRAALRTYRVEVLGEDPFKLHTRRAPEGDASAGL